MINNIINNSWSIIIVFNFLTTLAAIRLKKFKFKKFKIKKIKKKN